jgi:hypothetical protein
MAEGFLCNFPKPHPEQFPGLVTLEEPDLWSPASWLKLPMQLQVKPM